MDCAMPFIGQLVAGVVPPTSTGWLKCDGTSVSKALYPELYAILAGMVTEDTENFNLPDFRDRIPMGAGSIVNVLDAAGESEHTLTVEELPAHAHAAGDHTHDLEQHSHEIAAHFHTVPIPSHDHSVDLPGHTHGVTLPSHTHSVTLPSHTHPIPGRDNSAPGTGNRFVKSDGSGTINDSVPTQGGGSSSVTSASGGSASLTSASGGSATVSTSTKDGEVVDTSILPSNFTGFGRDINALPFTSTKSGGGGDTSAAGGGQSFDIIPPVLGVHWFIFAGCKEGC